MSSHLLPRLGVVCAMRGSQARPTPEKCRRQRRRAAVWALAVVLGASIVGVGTAPGSAADTTVSLGLSRYHDMLVDQAHGHLFFTQGPGLDGVLVTDLEGARVTMITGQPGASGLALDPDGTKVYVALANADAISVIDTATLTEVARYSTGLGTCPMQLAATASHLWFSFDDCRTSTGVGTVDLGREPTVRLWYEGFASWPLLSLAGERLALGGRRMLPAEVKTFDISSGEPVLLASHSNLGRNLIDLQVTPTGTQVITAFGDYLYHPVWRTDDLSAEGSYASGGNPRAVAISDDNTLVAVAWWGGDPQDIRVYRRQDGQLMRTWDFGTGYGMKMAERGLEFSPDGSRLYAVTTDKTIWDETADDPQLHVLDNPGLFRTALQLSGPTTTALDEPVLLTGRLASEGDQPVGGKTVEVTRSDTFGDTQTLSPVVTEPDGSFSIRDTPPNGGDVTYTVAYRATPSGRPDSSAAFTLAVQRPTPNLQLDTDKATYNFGATADLTISLTTESQRTVHVYAHPADGSRRLIFTGEVPPAGLTLQRVMQSNTEFSATIAEDARALAASTSIRRSTRIGLTTQARYWYDTLRGYKLYRQRVNPVFTVTARPRNGFGGCIHMQLQRRYASGWRTTSKTPCLQLDPVSRRVRWTLGGRQTTMTPYRVRPTFPGDFFNAAGTGPWVYFKFV